MIQNLFEERQAQEKMFKELISSLQIKFNGQNESDKLNFELNHTTDGLKFLVSGTGQANYDHQENLSVFQVFNEVIKKQDSLFNQRLNTIQSENKKYLNELETKRKEVEIFGLQQGIYLVITLAILLLIFLNWISKQFNIKKVL